VIQEIKRGGVTVLLVEQDAASTLRVSDRVYVLEHGRVAMDGAAHALQQNERVAPALSRDRVERDCHGSLPRGSVPRPARSGALV